MDPAILKHVLMPKFHKRRDHDSKYDMICKAFEMTDLVSEDWSKLPDLPETVVSDMSDYNNLLQAIILHRNFWRPIQRAIRIS